MTLAAFQRARRKVQTRIVPFKCILGDANDNPYAPDAGYYWVRRFDRADANGISTPGTPFRVRSGSAIIVPRGGRQVWVGTGLDGHLTVLGFVHEDLVAPGVNIDPRAAQPNDPYRAWIRWKQLQNFRALPVATGNTASMLVQVRQLFYYTEEGDIVRYNGTNADTHIDLTDYVPAANLQRYAVLWLRTYNPNGLDDIQVTVSTPIDSLDLDLSFDDLQECADAADADAIPIQAFRLANAQTTLTMDDAVDVDLRQFMNMPQVYGFPNAVARQYRVHEDYDVIAPSAVTVSGSGAVQIQDNAALVILDWDYCACETGGGSVDTSGFVTSVSGSAPISSSGGTTPTISHNTSGVSAGDYIKPNLSVNATGHITAATTGVMGYVRMVLYTSYGTPLPACTYNNGTSGVGATLTANANGALTIDGTGVSAGNRILVNGQATLAHQGIYEVTAAGSAGTPWVLTRTTDADSSDEILYSLVYVRNGSTYSQTLWHCNVISGPITIGTTDIFYLPTVASNLATALSLEKGGTSANLGATGGAHQVVMQESASAAFTVRALLPGDIPVYDAILTDEKSSGTQGGASSSTTWNARDLNTEVYDPHNLVSISSNQFTLIAGTYRIQVWSIFGGGAAAASQGRSRLYNVTGAAVIRQGTNATANTAQNALTYVEDVFTSNGTDALRVETYTSVGRTGAGLGVTVTSGQNEVYTWIGITQTG